ncbi:O-antigen ligase family protein [Achromobacter sp.]|uniref:O-antigen ligase family protein n=1 Tax=Achromobacter sp. TaxID=134375 RepID=UPI003917D8FF
MPRLYVSLTTCLVLLVPALALTSPVGGPAVLYLAGLISLAALAGNAVKHYEPMDFRAMWPMSLALLLPLVCLVATFAVRGVWSNSELEKLLRFALAVPVLWLLLRAPQRWLKHVQWSILAGAVAGSVLLIVTLKTVGRGGMIDVGGRYNAVSFANITLLLGMMTLLSLGWGACTRWPRAEMAVKLGAATLTVYATWVSETRSSWMLLPIVALIFMLGLRDWNRKHKVYCALGVIAVLAISAATIWTYSTRMQDIAKDLQGFSTSANRDTSFGTRLQLWQASIMMFEKSPIVGVGPSKFRDELLELESKGVVTRQVIEGYGEPHNDLLAALSGYGLLGLISILTLYLLPAAIFFRRLASDDRVIRVGAQLGLLFCLGFCAFSLTEMMFRNMRSVPNYSLIVVTLIALTTPRLPRPPRAVAADQAPVSRPG